MKEISVIIPAYNEEKSIAKTLDELLKVMEKSSLDYEIIVINDGSTDNTLNIIKNFRKVTLLQHKTNQGYGASLKTGINAAKFENIAITDSDGTYPNALIPSLALKLTPDVDMIVGWRKGFSAKIPLVRRPVKWVLQKFAEFVAGYQIPDLNSGLRVFRRQTILDNYRILPDGFSFSTTITLLVASGGGNIVYEPIKYHHRVGTSKFRPIKDTWGMITLIVRSVLLFSPLRVFVPLTLVCFLLATTVLALSFFYLDHIPDGTISVLYVSGIQFLFMGLLADLINRRSK